MQPREVGLHVVALPVLSVALVHNGIGVLDQVRISNDGAAMRGAELVVTVRTLSASGAAGDDAAGDDHTAGAAGDGAASLGTATVALDLPAGGTVTVAPVPCSLDAAAFAGLSGAIPGEVAVKVRIAGRIVAGETCAVTILGAGLWAADPVTLGLETLASFVQPQDPSLDALVGAAAPQPPPVRRVSPASPLSRPAPALGTTPEPTSSPTSPRDPAVLAYLDGPEGVNAQVRALYEALRNHRIRLLGTAPGWPTAPQEIRGAGRVLADRAGTALDITVLLASALERMGLHPLVWIDRDGPLVGYWRQDRSLPAAAVTDVDGAVNLVDLGLIGTLDASLAAESGADADFSHAVASCGPRLHGDLSGLVGVLDVAAARRDRIDPLPVRIVGGDGSVRIVDFVRQRNPIEGWAARRLPGTEVSGDNVMGDNVVDDDVSADAASPAPGAGAPRTGAPSPPVPSRVAQWKNALLDLSLRNRLLNFTARGAVNLAAPPGMLGAVEDVLADGGEIVMLPADQLSDVQVRRGIRSGRDLTAEERADLLTTRHSVYTDLGAERYRTGLRSLAYRARTIVDETGANHLHLALGTLVWNLDGRNLRSPVVLVPVTLTPRTRRGLFQIELDQAGASTPNYCLLEKLRQVHGLVVPGLAEPVEDASGIDLGAAFQALRAALAVAGLNFRVELTLDLALLAFAKFRLWKDLAVNWPDLARNPLVHHLITSPTTTFADPVADSGRSVHLDALTAKLPIPADASQVEAIDAAVAGHTFVLEGPPGTGKSQTITNLLAHAMTQGRRVLFVAEKRAALDVVTRRLDAIGLTPFCLDLHDKGAKPATIRAQLRSALDWHATADQQGLAAAAEQLRSATAELARYATRLHERNAAGLSYYSAHTQSLAVGDGAILPIPPHVVAAPDVDLSTVRAALAALPDVADAVRPRPHHPWGFVDPPDPAGTDPSALAAATVAVDAAIDREVAAPEVLATLQAAHTPTHVVDLARFAGEYAVDLALLDEAVTDRWRAAAAAARSAVVAFAAADHPELEVVTPQVFALPVDSIDAAARQAAASSWFGRRKRQLAVLARLSEVLRPGIVVPRKHIVDLTGDLAGVWKQIVALQLRVAAVSGLATPDGWNPLTPQGLSWLDGRIRWLTWASDSASLRDRSGSGRGDPGPFRLALRQLLESRTVVGLDDRDALERLAGALTGLARIFGGDAPFAAWAGGGLLATWRGTAVARLAGEPGLATLRRYLALLAHLAPLRPAGLDGARALLLSGAIPAADAARAFDSGVAAASLDERAATTGLDGFEPAAHDRAVRRFLRASEEVRGHLSSAIPAAMLASRTFDPASGFGRVGELARELGKQRRGLAVRPLLTRYGALVTALMPCTLVSPDSLARFFPPQPDLFDLVVFDEASQIRVSDAIGALGRARAAVVVGDSKQMPPTSVAESIADPLSGDDAADGEATDGLLAVVDEESILSECVQAGVPRRWLSWHYRSQDEALIAFSNRRYYEDRLSTFPSPLDATADPGVHGHGISLIRVPGRFLRSGVGQALRTNPVEAQAVVAEIRRRFDADRSTVPSIGVVTFNAPQRTLIESLLRDMDDENITAALDRIDGAGLFVKNLENVQGDERDVILFSTAFSANARGVLPLNFGPLNQIGGERRLNVAITRARRQVLVFCSFDPADLRAEQTSAQGVKDLQVYLELASSGTRLAIGSSARAPAPDRHRDEVADALRARGLTVTTGVGLSDFTLDLVVGAAGTAGEDGTIGTAGEDGTVGTTGPTGDDAARIAVLLDGPQWAARRTVGDRDGLPVQVLSTLMRWPAVRRVWLPEWLRDRESVLDRLASATDAALAGGAAAEPGGALGSDPKPRPGREPSVDPVGDFGEESADAPAGGSPGQRAVPAAPVGPSALPGGEVAVSPSEGDDARRGRPPTSAAPGAAMPNELGHGDRGGVPNAATPIDAGSFVGRTVTDPPPLESPIPDGLPGETRFTPWYSGYLGSRSVLDRLPAATAAAQVQRALLSAIRAEGPVHVDRLAKLVAGGFDLGRVSAERRDAILKCLPASVFRDPADPSFAWPDDLDPALWTGFRQTGEHADRLLAQVSAREIGNAMVAVCVAGAGASRDQLDTETLRVFGSSRRTAGQLALLDAALRRAVVEGRLVEDGATIRAGETRSG